jgi:hypothetical protein
MNIEAFVILLIPVVLQLLIINYLFKLEKNGCTCAMDYKRTYILSYLVINMIVVILSMFFDVLSIKSNFIGLLLLNLYSIAGIINIIFVIKYVNMLKDKKCGCSESVYRDILYVSSIIDALLLGMAILMFVYFIIFYKISLDVKGNKKGKNGKKLRIYKR